MNDITFDFSTAQVVAGSERFPADRHPLPTGHPTGDVSYLARGSEFGRHVWDESGH